MNRTETKENGVKETKVPTKQIMMKKKNWYPFSLRDVINIPSSSIALPSFAFGAEPV
jgi:hypothetical protein